MKVDDNYLSNATEKIRKVYLHTTEWPYFQENIQHLNNKSQIIIKSKNGENESVRLQEAVNTVEPTYAKNFVYHRIIGTF